MITLGESIKDLRKKQDWTQEDLAQILRENFNSKTNRVMISKWETGKQVPEMYTVICLADVFGVSVNYLTGKTERMPVEKRNQQNGNFEIPTQIIPILDNIAAGLPLYAEQQIEGYTVTELNHSGEYFALRVKGDSMNMASIFDGSIIVVRRQPVIENGDIAVVLVNDEDATVKRWRQEGEKVTLIPQSNNIDHLPQQYDLRTDKIDIQGKVVRIQIEAK